MQANASKDALQGESEQTSLKHKTPDSDEKKKFPARKKGQQRQKKVPGPISPPLPKVAPGAKPIPKYLANEASAPKNDPMWIDFDCDGFDGLVPYNARNEFAVTTEGYIPLVERQFDALQALDRNFTKFISKSMFLWYCCQHLYARMIAIKATQGEASYEEEKFLDYVKSENYPLPQPVDEYLRSIGNTTDGASTKYMLAFPVWPNAEGHFDRVGPNTHYGRCSLHLITQQLQALRLGGNKKKRRCSIPVDAQSFKSRGRAINQSEVP